MPDCLMTCAPPPLPAIACYTLLYQLALGKWDNSGMMRNMELIQTSSLPGMAEASGYRGVSPEVLLGKGECMCAGGSSRDS